MITRFSARLAIDSRDTLGEGPTWDVSGGRLLWSDNAVGIVHEARTDGEGGWRESRRWNLESQVGTPVPKFGTVIPRSKGGLVIAGGTEVFMMEPSGSITPFVRLEADPSLVRFNDAKCDSQGRLWVGTLSTDFTTEHGALYRIDPDGSVTTMLNKVVVSNGLDWSPDGTTFYYIDSPRLSLDAFDFDPATGSISNRRTIVRVKFGEGILDGMTVDSEGGLWVAVAGSGEVRRYAPDGTLLVCVAVSAPLVTSCTFGGVSGKDLFITSAAMRLSGRFLEHGFSTEVVEKAHTAPGAGGVFHCQPGVSGKPATPFAG
jgi:sugar lactone lactonase YvrE